MKIRVDNPLRFSSFSLFVFGPNLESKAAKDFGKGLGELGNGDGLPIEFRPKMVQDSGRSVVNQFGIEHMNGFADQFDGDALGGAKD